MSDFTVQDVENAIDDGDFQVRVGWGDRKGELEPLDDDIWYTLGDGDGVVTLNGVEYEWTSVADIGGMDQGSYAAVIFKVGDRLFRKEGYYASHYGTDWDGNFEEVEVYEKTVKDYRAV